VKKIFCIRAQGNVVAMSALWREEKVNEGARRMPRHTEAKKDAVSCEKPWVGANGLRSTGVRMGQPTRAPGDGGGEPAELKHLSRRRRGDQNRNSPSSGERTGMSPNPWRLGVVGVVGRA
jgi:hypothetical protein